MNIVERQPEHVEQLDQLIRSEKDAELRDRDRVVLRATPQNITKDIQATLRRSRAFVQRWTYAYRNGAVAG